MSGNKLLSSVIHCMRVLENCSILRVRAMLRSSFDPSKVWTAAVAWLKKKKKKTPMNSHHPSQMMVLPGKISHLFFKGI